MRILALLEGISYLLFGITMPLKYMLGILEPNFFVGMVHGWLFVLYVLLGFQNIYLHRWSRLESFWVLVASLIPLGTFFADHRILKPSQIKSSQ